MPDREDRGWECHASALLRIIFFLLGKLFPFLLGRGGDGMQELSFLKRTLQWGKADEDGLRGWDECDSQQWRT